ncbi:MAG: DMT family transporter [Planctomycetota bacterium]
MTRRTSGILFVLGAAACWSLGGWLLKLTTASPGTIACYRSAVAGVVLMGVVLVRRIKPAGATRLLWLGLAYGATMFAFVIANRTTTAAAAIALQYTAPVWVVVFGMLLMKEKPSRGQVPAFVLCGVGTVLFFAVGQSDPAGTASAFGNGVALFSGLAFGAALALTRWLRRVPSVYLAGVGNLVAFVVMLPAALAWDHPGRTFTSPELHRLIVPMRDVLLILILGTVQTALPYALFAEGVKRIEAYRASLVCLSEPVMNPLWVLLFIGEVPTPAMIVGVGLILAGIATVGRRRPMAKLPPPD